MCSWLHSYHICAGDLLHVMLLGEIHDLGSMDVSRGFGRD
jgi:hypothetical protein